MNKLLMIEETIRAGLGRLSPEGALLVETGRYTGRATQEKFFVQRPEVIDTIDWGATNKPLPLALSREIFEKLEAKLQGERTYSMSAYVGLYPIDVLSLSPWHIAFSENMFRKTPIEGIGNAAPGKRIRVLHDPYGKVSDLGLSLPSEALILVDPVEMRLAIIGTAYAGEIKKGAFTLCNYALPELGVLPMHASANCLQDGSRSCLLFGLSGTGKTTLSASPDRYLIGDDEIVWAPEGLFNLEGGCYAKLIDLSEEKEPEIYHAVNRFGSILENVGYDEKSRRVDFKNRGRTENTRGSYEISVLDKVFAQERLASAPKSIIFLTADAFGALPAVARLDEWQAQYHFVSGYTAKVAGTEVGVKEPQAAFSTCFGAPFMPRHSSVYAKLLADFARKHGASVWLLNTGWTGGGYGKGERFPISVSRELVRQIQSGELDRAPMRQHPVFGFDVPATYEIPSGPQVEELAVRFHQNIQKFSGRIDREVIERGGPRIDLKPSMQETTVDSRISA